ncbi:hypothetical protein V5O48_013003 [Marasmius crinis-equi]|uniref:F-box domain-containing protein n=1 Tax=Marasmius crinis-equi TaxID=585013 RepID=A0ABR3F199_9AGAR
MITLTTPFSTVLGTNYSPSSRECGQIQSLLRDPEQRIHALDEQISKLQAERDELQTFVNHHRSLLSPVRRLSPEILGTIFVHSLPTNTFNLPGRTLADAPLLLTSICRSWREIALSTPGLWNGIHIHLPRFIPSYISSDDYLSKITRRKEGIKRWLERSGSLPLAISISVESSTRGVDNRRTEDIAILADVLKLFAAHCHRWRSVIFTSDARYTDPAIWEPFAELTKDDLPQLRGFYAFESLSAYNYSDRHNRTIPTPLASLITRPTSLHTLRITGEPPELFKLRIHWTHLKELHLKWTGSDRCNPSLFTLKVAESCPNLVSYKVVLRCEPSFSPIPYGPAPPHHWPHLRNLDLTIDDSAYQHRDKRPSGAFWRVFRGMTAPALKHLSLRALMDVFMKRDPIPTAGPALESIVGLPFQDMISESGCTITHLSLSSMFLMSEEAILRSLELLPSLSSLTLTECADGLPCSVVCIPHQKLTSCLVSLSFSADICPDVAELSTSECHAENIQPIISFAEARSNKLERLSVNFGAVTRETAGKITEIMSSTDIRDSLHELREGRRVKIDWKWTVNPDVSDRYSKIDCPYTGM